MKTSRIVLGCILAAFAFMAGGAGAQVVTEFSVGITSSPHDITAGPDGNLWFTEPDGNRIGRITPLGVATEFSAGITAGAGPYDITAGPDGNLWFTERVGRIGRITPDGVVTEFSAGITANAHPYGITAGPDGNLWFTEPGSPFGYRGIGRITPLGVVTEFSAGISGVPGQITAGPDGNLWFTERVVKLLSSSLFSRIGRITPQGVVTEFGIIAGTGVGYITAGPDGNLWFTEPNGNRIGRITPAGVVTEFSAGVTAGAWPTGITAGPDGNLWFTEGGGLDPYGSRIGRITPAGVVTEFIAGITPSAHPYGITAGPDGNLWFTEANGIGRITTCCSPPPATTTIVSSVNPSQVGQAVVFTASVAGNFPTGTVQFREIAGAWGVPGPLGSPVTLSGGGVAQLITSTLTEGTHGITAVYSGDLNNAASSSAVLLQTVNGSGGGTSINVALASNGGVASASSTYVAPGYAFPVAAINNGDRAGLNWGNGGGWNDATANAFPDWVQINFNGTQTINQVIVYTLQDNYANPVDPPATLTFTQYGVTDFQVQGWNGAAWVTLGAVSGNNLVKRTVSFAAFSTDRIRVNITGALASYSRITEIEAWTAAGSPPTTSTTTLTSSLNPAKVNQSVTFTASVTGTNPTGTVAFTSNGAAIAGCGSVPLSGAGDAPSAACTTSFAGAATYSIVASYSGDGANPPSASSPLSEVVTRIKKGG
jgi:streptogramin lyase